ncbi:MAG TPA: peptidoglycan-binding domain-containing protein, partial [Blastocatellia bacterium]|nr:peptidoglycan-binding domain-containing protein [Blastocatellia bacterium]
MAKSLVAIALLLLVPTAVGSTFRKTKHRAQKQTDQEVRIEKERILNAQLKLAELGYWVGDANGVAGVEFRNALIAFQKIGGLKRTGQLSAADIEVLADATTPAPKATEFAHIEVDLTHQVLFFVSTEGKVSNILPISTGSGKPFTSQGSTRNAITPT